MPREIAKKFQSESSVVTKLSVSPSNQADASHKPLTPLPCSRKRNRKPFEPAAWLGSPFRWLQETPLHHGKGIIVSFTKISNGAYNVSSLTSPLKTRSYIAMIDL